MRGVAFLAACAVVGATPVVAQVSAAPSVDPVAYIAGSIAACNAWVGDPQTWAEGIEKFPAASGVPGLVSKASVPAFATPPAGRARAMHHWYVGNNVDSGAFITTSDIDPFCFAVAGSAADIQPNVEAVIASPSFTAQWKQNKDLTRDDMRSTTYRHRTDSGMFLMVSRAKQAGLRTDRPQFVMTLWFDLDK